MNVSEIPESEAFKAGSDLWVLKNDFKNKWWQEIDFRSGFLLSHCLQHSKKPTSVKLNEIVELTEYPRANYSDHSDLLLLGSTDHFLNKWILLWNTQNSQVAEFLEKISKTLQFSSIRLFTDSELILNDLKSRPKTSLTDIAFIKNT